MYVAFLFGAKLTVLGATNGVARVKIQAEVFFCSVGGQPCGKPSNKMGLVFPSGKNRTLACSARGQDISVCVEYVEQISGLQQSTFQGARSDSKLLAIYLRWKHTNTNIRI